MAHSIRLRWIPFVLLVAVLAAACQPAPPAAAPATSAPQPTAPPANTQPAAPEPVTLRFMIPEGGGRSEGFAAAITAYRAVAPNVAVELQVVPYGEYFGLLPVQFAGDSPADIALIDSSATQSYAYNEAILPLTSLFSEADRADFMESLVEAATLEGQLYAGPFFQSTQGVFYNVDHFAAAGVEAPARVSDAWTWPEFVEKVGQVTAAQGEGTWGLVFLANPPGAGWAQPLMRSNGAPGSPTFQAISPDGTQAGGYVDTPEALEAYRFWQSLYTEHKLAPQSDVPDAFGTGQASTMISFSAWGGVLDAVFPDLNWAVMPLPYLKTPIAHAGHFMLTVAAKSAHPEEAMAFVQWLTTREGFLAYNAVTSDMPARKSLLNELPAFQEGPLRIFRDVLLETAQPYPSGPGGAIYSEIMSRTINDIALGADVESTVQAAVLELDSQLAQFK